MRSSDSSDRRDVRNQGEIIISRDASNIRLLATAGTPATAGLPATIYGTSNRDDCQRRSLNSSKNINNRGSTV